MAFTEGSSRAPGVEQITGFGDRLAERVAVRESQLVLGLDPDPARLWPAAIRRAQANGTVAAPPAMRAARAVAAHCALVIEAAGEQCVAVKLQVACFERLGAPGWSVLAETVARAREHGLLVIADAKRGDIGVTAAAYAQAFLDETPTPFGPVPGLGVDALTVNPLLGRDSLEPFTTAARGHGSGLFVLVRTSNPGAAEVQERALADGGSVSGALAALVDEIGFAGTGRSGLSDVGAVVGATAPDRLHALRERMPHAPFLLPGVGAQGGRVEELAPAFMCGPAGGLIAASRGIVAAHEQTGGDPAAAAAREAARIRDLAWRVAA
ncbi:MAG: orotidine-5'-phosphate decarboxylase [Solirubrobacterales bacterium]|nr:orotidine-5'-phosphate decarboxylase [Solirubrobacterales bacterium]